MNELKRINYPTDSQTDRQTKQVDRGQNDRWTNDGENNTKNALGIKDKKEIRKRRNREKKADHWNSKVSINLFFHTAISWSIKVGKNY